MPSSDDVLWNALDLWQGLVRGEWTAVDSFERDGRRFVLAKRNGGHRGHLRGLTPRELQVLTYAARGESHKATGYRLGLSAARVSSLLKSVMRKLGVRSQAQLVLLMRGLHQHAHAS